MTGSLCTDARQVPSGTLDFQSMRRFSPVRVVRVLLTTTLSLWVAGAGCFLGCEGMIASAANSGSAESTHHGDKAPIVVSGEACASGEANTSHDCCKKNSKSAKPSEPTRNRDSSLLELSGSSSGEMNGCPLAVSRAAVIAKTRGSDLDSAPALVQSILPDLNSSEQTAPLSSPLRLPNRGHTYLRCCVFRI